MGCISPIDLKLKNRFGDSHIYSVPCGHCLNCLIKKESQFIFLAQKELLYNYRAGKSASFVTLTYDDEHLPINENGFVTLRRSDVQKFIKNMRRQMEYHGVNLSFKYAYCGEYGDGSHSTSSTGVSTCRSHYHIIFIGLSPEQVTFYTRKLWKMGLCDVGPLSSGGLRYICKYMTKARPDKDVKLLRQLCNVQNPFFYHSVGFGKQWILDNMDRIVEDCFTFNLNGKRYLFPKHVLSFVSNHTGISYIPFVKQFLSNDFKLAESKGITYNQYAFERDFINYQYKVASLRSQNKPINDFTLSKKWCKPISYLDRDPRISELAELALYGDVVPF